MSLDQIQLETSGKGDKITKEDATSKLRSIGEVRQYLETLTQKSGKNHLENPKIQGQITAFLEKSANNTLSQNLEKFNAKKFDTDGEAGLDKYEFDNFSKALKGAIAQIVTLDGAGAFERVHSESKESGWTTPDKFIAGNVDVGNTILGVKGKSSFIEEAIKKVGTISPEELHKMSEKPFSLSVESIKELAILLAKEIGSGVEDMIRFVTNIPSGLILLPRYLSYRVNSNSSDIKTQTEGEIKLSELVEGNSSLAIVELLGEKGIQMIAQLSSMMKSGKQGDIAMLMVTIAGLIVGVAGALKITSSLARKSAVRTARMAGSERRKAGELMGRESRNMLRDVSKVAGTVAKVANNVDTIVSGTAAIGKLTKVVAVGVKKVAPALGNASNDAGNMSELEGARAKKEAGKIADAANTAEMQGTGTHGPATGPRNSSDANAGSSSNSLKGERNPPITREVIARAYAQSGVNPMEVQKNARLGDLERIGKAEKILGRTLDTGEQLAIDHIHKNISKGIYSNTRRNLQKMYDTWESMTHHKRTTDIVKNQKQYAEFRKLVENGILGTDSGIVIPAHTPSVGRVPEATKPPHNAFHSPEITRETEDILRRIHNKGSTDFLETLLSGKPINQAQLNALVHEYSSGQGLDPAKLHTLIEEIFEISGYVGNQSDMYAHAIAFTKEKAMRGRIPGNITAISAKDMIIYLGQGIDASSELLKAFLKNGSSSTKESFLQILIDNDALRVNILRSNGAEDLLGAISENTKNLGRLVVAIINNEALLKSMAPEHLKTIDTIIEKMIRENSFNGGLIETLRTKLALARDAKSPKNRIANFLQNGDDATAKLLGAEFSSERLAWNMMFEDYRLVDNGNMKQLNMLMRGESKFFHSVTLDTFFDFSFWNLKKSIQQEFIKKYVSPPDGKYHFILNEFQKFQKELMEKGMI